MGERRVARYDRQRDMTVFSILLFAAALSSSWSGVKLGPANLGDIAMLAALVVGVIESLVRRVRLQFGFWMVAPVLVGLLALGNSVIVMGAQVGDDADGKVSPDLLFSRVLLSTTVVALLIAIAAALNSRLIPKLIAVWCFGVVASSIVSVAQSIGISTEVLNLQQAVSELNSRYTGLASHPNSLAQACGLAMPLLVYFATSARSTVRKIVALLGLVVVIQAIFVSGSRAGLILGFIALVASIIAFIAQTARRRRLLLPLLLAGAVAAYFVIPALIAGTRLDSGDAGALRSTEGRLTRIADGWGIFTANPLLGNQVTVWYGELSWLVILANGGVFLLLAYLLFISRPVVEIFRNISRPPLNYLGLSTLLAIGFSFLNNGAFERFTFWPMLMAWAYGVYCVPRNAYPPIKSASTQGSKAED